MSKRIRILGSACNMIGGLIGVLGWLLRFARLMLAPKVTYQLWQGEGKVVLPCGYSEKG